jgi:hypothetical protein
MPRRTFHPIRFGRYSPYGAFAEESDSPAVQAVVRMRREAAERTRELAAIDGAAVGAAEKLRAAFPWITAYYAAQTIAIIASVYRSFDGDKAGEAVQRLTELGHVPHTERARAEGIIAGAMKERGTCKA